MTDIASVPAAAPVGAPAPSTEYSKEQLDAYRNQPGIIVIDTTKKVPANVLLGNRPYRVLPMKSLVLINMTVRLQDMGDDPARIYGELEKMVTQIFGRKTAPQIMSRLTDNEDDLDLPDIMALIRDLAKKSTRNPTS